MSALKWMVPIAALAFATPALAQEPPPGAGATAVVKEPPAMKGPGGSESNTRADPGKLRQELSELEKKLKYYEDKMNLGHETSKAWNDVKQRVDGIIESHQQQDAACRDVKARLDKRIADGTPPKYLEDIRQSYAKCDDARKRYRTTIETMKVEVERMLVSVKDITETVEDLKTGKIEALRRKAVLDQMSTTSLGNVKSKIDDFDRLKDFQGH